MAFSPINSWQEAANYAGRLVAFQSDSDYFGAGRGISQENVQFGCVSEDSRMWHETEEGYLLSKLLRIGEESYAMRSLIDSRLREGGLSMRFATDDELQFVKRNITAGTGYFEFMIDKQKMLGILERQMSSLPAGQ